MKIKVLIENTSASQEFLHEHGLSIYLETGDRKILFDTGASERYMKNAALLGVDLSQVDFLVISHGHYDHGGGLKVFLKENDRAKIFLHPLAFENYYARTDGQLKYIGLDQELKDHPRFVFTDDYFMVERGLELFSNVDKSFSMPEANKNLLMEKNGNKVADIFSHEQSLIVEEEGKTLLLTGCSHSGIRNILEQYKTMKGKMPDVVIGGFHLASPGDSSENLDSIDQLGRDLLETGVMFYTGHCTGESAFLRLKTLMGKRISYLPAGSEMTL